MWKGEDNLNPEQSKMPETSQWNLLLICMGIYAYLVLSIGYKNYDFLFLLVGISTLVASAAIFGYANGIKFGTYKFWNVFKVYYALFIVFFIVYCAFLPRSNSEPTQWNIVFLTVVFIWMLPTYVIYKYAIKVKHRN